MSRQVYFAGSEPDCLTGNYTLSTTGVDTNYVRTGFNFTLLQSATMALLSPVPGNTTEGYWLHYRKYQNGQYNANGQDPVTIYDADGNLSAVLVDSYHANTRARVYANDNTYTDSGETAVIYGSLSNGVTVSIDIHVFTDANGDAKMEVYVNQALVLSVIDTSGYSRGISYVVLRQGTTAGNYYNVYSEFIVANFDTRNLRVGTYIPAGDGTYTDGTGSYADIDETNPDGTAITLANVGDKRSYTLSKYGNPGLSGILAVAVNGLVASDGTNDLQAGLRIGGVDYFSSDLNLGAAPLPTSMVWNAHPGTAAHLPQNPATDIEVIYKAVA